MKKQEEKAHPLAKPVLQMREDGHVIRRFPSSRSVEDEGKFSQAGVSKACISEGVHRGFYWMYEEDFNKQREKEMKKMKAEAQRQQKKFDQDKAGDGIENKISPSTFAEQEGEIITFLEPIGSVLYRTTAVVKRREVLADVKKEGIIHR